MIFVTSICSGVRAFVSAHFDTGYVSRQRVYNHPVACVATGPVTVPDLAGSKSDHALPQPRIVRAKERHVEMRSGRDGFP